MNRPVIAAAVVCILSWIHTASGVQNRDIHVHRNLGKAHYERGEYSLAVRELLAVLELEGAGARDSVNAGLALLQNLDRDGALGAFTTAKRMAPEMIEVDFGLGVLYKRQLRYPLALDSFQRVVARDPEDPCSWFNIGAVASAMKRWDEAEQAFQQVLKMGFPVAQNFYVGSLFRLATLKAQQGESEAAKPLFEEFQRLRAKLPNVALTASALENGKYGQIEFPQWPAGPPRGDTPAPVFSPRGQVRFADSPCKGDSMRLEPSLALGDYDVDGAVDIFVANPCGENKLFRNEGGGGFADVTSEAGLAASRQATAALFVNYDNKKSPSLVILGSQGLRLYQNRNGKFTDVTRGSGLAAEAATDRASLVSFDFDNDGLLDLFVSGVGQTGRGQASDTRLYRNNGDGTFENVSGKAGLEVHAVSRSRGAGFADFDEDGFSDLLVVMEGANGALLSNRGNGTFGALTLSLGDGPRGRRSARVRIGDFNHDGWFDAFVLDEAGYSLLLNRQGRLELASGLRPLVPHPERWAVAMDADGNGRSDVLLRDREGGFRLLAHQQRDRFEQSSVEVPSSATGFSVWADLEGNGSTELLAAGSDGLLRLFHRERPAGTPWLVVRLEGLRTNLQAMGAVLEVKAGLSYQKHLAQGLPLTVYPSGHTEVDVVRVTWSNGVVQNEVGVGTQQRLEVVEAERQTSSCPFLYVWDGTRFRFLTDVVGRAPLGEPLPGGGWLVPNPEDYVRIPPGSMRERDGQFVFQVTEELKEIAYLDAIELVAVDHPGGAVLYANEKFSSPPFEPFHVHRVADRWAPVRAVDGRGRNVLPDLLEADGRLVGGFAPHRIPGLAEMHDLILEPGDVPSRKPLKLFLTGWVYWAASSSMKALSKNGSVSIHPPELQVKDDDGSWVTVSEDIGLPSGLNRTLVVDLTDKFLSSDSSIRIVTNLRVYWDQAFFASGTQLDTPVLSALKPVSADLHYRGFSTPFREGGFEAPLLFDYSRLLPQAPWNAPAGRYTGYGDVRPVIDVADDQLVVMAPGDELTVVFDGEALPTLRSGWRRDFFLHFTGWAKDNDPNTAFSRTVEPLPHRNMADYARATSLVSESPEIGSYLEWYQTRRVPLLIAPLAPPSVRQGHVTSESEHDSKLQR